MSDFGLTAISIECVDFEDVYPLLRDTVGMLYPSISCFWEVKHLFTQAVNHFEKSPSKCLSYLSEALKKHTEDYYLPSYKLQETITWRTYGYNGEVIKKKSRLLQLTSYNGRLTVEIIAFGGKLNLNIVYETPTINHMSTYWNVLSKSKYLNTEVYVTYPDDTKAVFSIRELKELAEEWGVDMSDWE